MIHTHRRPSTLLRRMLAAAPAASVVLALVAGRGTSGSVPPEVRGTWLTTTANDAISTPARTAVTMRRLKEIGLNTVYVETWKNGYTQFPSKVLKRAVGVDRRPNLMPQDPSDTDEQLRAVPRDLLQETLIEAHRNGLAYIAWFEYGFMAAHKGTDNHLRRMKKEWLSLDRDGNEVAPNGFVWMNPLHPEAREFLVELVLEAVENYDLDGVQLDDRIVWPHVSMGYDPFTVEQYRLEHDGKEPPRDFKDPDWMRWRASKVTEYAREFTSRVRAARPGLIISVSPAPYPWVYENYLCEWPTWAKWGAAQGWDEFIPQVYRFDFPAFKATWLDQLRHIAPRGRDLIAGIRVVGEGPDYSWDDLRRSIDLVREGGGGHVHWFSRGVLDVYPKELTAFYDVMNAGPAPHPRLGPLEAWRPAPILLTKVGPAPQGADAGSFIWTYESAPIDEYRLMVKRGGVWSEVPRKGKGGAIAPDPGGTMSGSEVLPADVEAAELLADRRPILRRGSRTIHR